MDLGSAKNMLLRKKNLFFVFAVILLLLQINCMAYVKGLRKNALVRVALICNADRVSVSGIKDHKYYKNLLLTTDQRYPLYFSPKNGFIYVNNRKYRGALKIQKLANKLWVINIINIEDYLKGVVPCEIGKITENILEAAKAQAVAARTYAVAHLNQYEELGFDLYATIKDQVYNGYICETKLTNRAVDQTRGQILIFNNQPIEAKYHSTCGGRTADFNDAWSGSAPDYLSSVICPYCKKSPHYAWQKVFSKKSFFSHLRNGLKKIDIVIPGNELIKDLIIVRNKKSKRIKILKIITTKNKYIISGFQIRTVFGDKQDPGGLLKSNFINFKSTQDSIIIEGHGFGHGVGMCQFGAIEMARRGKNYKQILYFYYSGVRLAKILS